VLLLALDTCDSRGSLALLRGEELLSALPYEGPGDYSSWVLPKAKALLGSCGLGMRDVEVFAVASGPGSFTGVRIGLTTVKAWGEAYGKPVVGVSRLESMASAAAGVEKYVAALVDAHRNQAFAGLYRREQTGLHLVEHEMVAAPDGFVKWVGDRTEGTAVSWISMDPEMITALDAWLDRAHRGENVQRSPAMLAPLVGKVGLQRALAGRTTDALGLDAEYVRRSDAEVFWKGGPTRGG
jgi:tRNA threonylcarbamoyladenosine biosynthesis protein TsaB